MPTRQKQPPNWERLKRVAILMLAQIHERIFSRNISEVIFTKGSLSEHADDDLAVVSDIVQELKRQIPSILEIKEFPINDPRPTSDRIIIRFDPAKFEQDLKKFVGHVEKHDRLIFRDEQGVFWYKKNRTMNPKNESTDYWNFFKALYDIAMNGEEKRGTFFASYDALYKKLENGDFIQRSTMEGGTDKKFRAKIQNIVKNQFHRKPGTFGLDATFNDNDIISIERDNGVKLFNPIYS